MSSVVGRQNVRVRIAIKAHDDQWGGLWWCGSQVLFARVRVVKGCPHAHTLCGTNTQRKGRRQHGFAFLTREEAFNTMASVAAPLAAPASAPAPAAAAAVAGGGAVAPIVTPSVKATIAVPAVAVPVAVPGAVPGGGGRSGGKRVHEGGSVRAMSCPAVSHQEEADTKRQQVAGAVNLNFRIGKKTNFINPSRASTAIGAWRLV